MRIVLLALVILSTFTPAHAQGPATGIAKDAARGSKTAPLSVDALCAQLTLDEVTAIVGRNFERRPEKSYQVCKYGDSREKGKLQVRYFSLGNSRLTEASWRKFVESEGKGKVIERDGVLVSHFRRDKFGTDSIWFKDRQGHALELNVNSGITEDQAVALAKSAMD
jgi:formylglycine-generating enzyme required for sulfatase activity